MENNLEKHEAITQIKKFIEQELVDKNK